MTTTPTAALVEDAEKITEGVPADWTACSCNKCGLVWALGEMHIATVELETGESDCAQPSPEQRRRIMDFMARSRSMIPELAAALRRAEAERDELRATVTRLNRRAQTAEAGVLDNVEACKAAGVSFGRTLANAAAAMYRRRAEQAEAERDAQHADVLRLTGERDELLKTIEELRALAFGLGCMLTNSREETEWQVEETRTLRREVRELSERLAGMPMPEDDDPAGKHLMSLINRRRELYQRVDELTATRDLLNEENARLRKERDAALAMETDTARRSSDEIDSLKAECNEARSETEDLNRRVAELHAQRDEARAQVWGLGCKVTNLRNALKRNEQQRRELGWRAASEEATMAEVVRLRFQSLHWFEENERHSKQMRDCLRQKFELTQETARLKAHIATLELLRRGGK